MPGVSKGDPTQTLQALLRAGADAQNKGDLDAAAKDYRSAAAYDPHSLEAWLRLGKVELASQHFQAALEAYRDAQTVRPNDPEAAFRLGEIELSLGKVSEATAQFDVALNARKHDAKLESAAGTAYTIQGKYAQAHEQFSAALAWDSGDPSFRNNYGLLQLATGDLKGAYTTFAALVQSHPTDRYRLNLALVELALGNASDALAVAPGIDEAELRRMLPAYYHGKVPNADPVLTSVSTTAAPQVHFSPTSKWESSATAQARSTVANQRSTPNQSGAAADDSGGYIVDDGPSGSGVRFTLTPHQDPAPSAIPTEESSEASAARTHTNRSSTGKLAPKSSAKKLTTVKDTHSAAANSPPSAMQSSPVTLTPSAQSSAAMPATAARAEHHAEVGSSTAASLHQKADTPTSPSRSESGAVNPEPTIVEAPPPPHAAMPPSPAPPPNPKATGLEAVNASPGLARTQSSSASRISPTTTDTSLPLLFGAVVVAIPPARAAQPSHIGQAPAIPAALPLDQPDATVSIAPHAATNAGEASAQAPIPVPRNAVNAAAIKPDASLNGVSRASSKPIRDNSIATARKPTANDGGLTRNANADLSAGKSDGGNSKASDSDFSLQIASLRSNELARREVERLKALLPNMLSNLSLTIVPVHIESDGIYYRVLAQPIEDAEHGAKQCAALRTHKIPCLVIKSAKPEHQTRDYPRSIRVG